MVPTFLYLGDNRFRSRVFVARDQSLMVDPAPTQRRSAPTIDDDHAEVDLPVASSVLGGESIFLQVKALHQGHDAGSV